jgi:hypothetical protein
MVNMVIRRKSFLGPLKILILVSILSGMNFSLTAIEKRKPVTRVVLHIIFWVCIVFYFAWGFGLAKNTREGFLYSLLYLPGNLLMTYTLLYFLTPVYLVRKKYIYFFTGLLLLLIICSCYAVFANMLMGVSPGNFKQTSVDTGQNVLPFINVAGIAFSIKFLENWRMQRRQTTVAQNAQLQAELELLKAQVHPHFLFNTLNNLYSHTLEQSDLAPGIVLKLSHLLRFMLYESKSPEIPLKTEVHIIQSYMELEQVRYGNRLDVSFVCRGELNDKKIAPLLLLPFVENAYKHGPSQQIDLCWISFDLAVEDNMIRFKLINSFDADEGIKTEMNKGGMGLQNVKRRLELIYPNKYSLDIRAEDNMFIVNLDLQIDCPNENIQAA